MDFITFNESVKTKLKQIDAEYRGIYKTYTPSLEELKFKAFLDDIWKPRYESDDLSEKLYAYGNIQVFFHYSKDTSIHISKIFSLRKLHPKKPSTAPLWYMLFRLSQEIAECNIYLCPNIMYHSGTTPCEKNVIASNCYFVDIDNANTKKPVYNMNQESIKKYLKKNYPIYSELKPKYILMSGRGLHLYFILEHTEMLASSNKTKPIKKVHKWITSDLITLYEADRACKNLNRLMRIPYSTNNKVNLQTKLYITDDKGHHSISEIIDTIKRHKACKNEEDNSQQFYDIAEAAKELNASGAETDNKADSASSRDITKKRNNNHGISSLCKIRKADLEKWFMHHLDDLDGRRHTFFWIYINNLKNMRTYKGIIYREAYSLNLQLVNPLSSNELDAIIESDKKIYRLTNESIADMLLMTETEVHELQSIYTEAERQCRLEIKQQDKERRREERLEHNKEIRHKNWEKYFEYMKAHPENNYAVMANDFGISKSYSLLIRREFRKIFPDAN